MVVEHHAVLRAGRFSKPSGELMCRNEGDGSCGGVGGKGGGMRDTISCVSNQHQSPELVKVTAPLTGH